MKKYLCLVICFIFVTSNFVSYSNHYSEVYEKFGEEIVDKYIRDKHYYNVLKDWKSSIAEKTEACIALGHDIHTIPGKKYQVQSIYKKFGKYTIYYPSDRIGGFYTISVKVSDVYIVEMENFTDKDALYMELECKTCNKKDRKILYLPKNYKIYKE